MKTPLSTPLLVFADDWGRHPSSCQHLVKRLRQRHPTLWVNTIGTRRVQLDGVTLGRGWEKVKKWCRGLRQVSEQMWVLDVPMLPSVGNRLSVAVNRRLVSGRVSRTLAKLGLADPVLITTLPHIWPLIRSLPRSGAVYYCVDDFSHWPGADGDAVRSYEGDLLRECDQVLAASQELQSRLSQSTAARYFPHAVDFDHFSTVDTVDPAPQIATLPRPRIGFFGLIYEKLDFELLQRVAVRFPHAVLVMIGPVVHCPESFRALPNVRLVGPVTYDQLPRWLKELDVLLLAYNHDEMTRQVNPLKLKECLATGKPIVSVNVPEARGFMPGIRVAEDREDFMALIEEALSESPDATIRSLRRSLVQDDTWNARADELHALVDTLRAAAL